MRVLVTEQLSDQGLELLRKDFQVDERLELAAGDLAASEVTPITDVRGDANYRRQLTRNTLLKFFHQSQPNLAPV